MPKVIVQEFRKLPARIRAYNMRQSRDIALRTPTEPAVMASEIQLQRSVDNNPNFAWKRSGGVQNIPPGVEPVTAQRSVQGLGDVLGGTPRTRGYTHSSTICLSANRCDMQRQQSKSLQRGTRRQQALLRSPRY